MMKATPSKPIRKVTAFRVLQKCGHEALTLEENSARSLSATTCKHCAETTDERPPEIPEDRFWQISE